jgi:hypothetical protein
VLDQDAPIRGEVRAVGFRRVSHGLYLKDKPSLPDAEQFLRELRAWLCVLPPDAAFTHVTGARLRNWRLPHLPEQVPVFVAVRDGHSRRCRAGLVYSRLVALDPDDHERVHIVSDLPVDTPEEVLLRCARDLGHLDLVVLVDSALACGDLDPQRMERILASRRPGTRALRAAWLASNARAESDGETVLRLFHKAMGIAVEPQVILTDERGGFVARADLLVLGTHFVHEYDGAGHRSTRTQRADLRRERRFAGTTYVRRGYTLDELLNHAGVVMHEMDDALRRPHRLDRLRRWQRMVRESLYSETGRSRVLNRWKREMGVVDWR